LLKKSHSYQDAAIYPCIMKYLRPSQANLDSEISAVGYTPGCWKHGSSPAMRLAPFPVPNGRRAGRQWAGPGLDAQSGGLWPRLEGLPAS
jgi:hypothetical protein